MPRIYHFTCVEYGAAVYGDGADYCDRCYPTARRDAIVDQGHSDNVAQATPSDDFDYECSACNRALTCSNS